MHGRRVSSFVNTVSLRATIPSALMKAGLRLQRLFVIRKQSSASYEQDAHDSASRQNNIVPFQRFQKLKPKPTRHSPSNVIPTAGKTDDEDTGDGRDRCWVIRYKPSSEGAYYYYSVDHVRDVDCFVKPSMRSPDARDRMCCGRAVVAYESLRLAEKACEHAASTTPYILSPYTSVYVQPVRLTSLVRRCRATSLNVMLMLTTRTGNGTPEEQQETRHRRQHDKLVIFLAYTDSCPEVRASLAHLLNLST